VHAHWKTTLIYLVFGLVLVTVLVISGDEVARNIDGIEAWVAQLGPWGGVAFVTLYVVITSMLVPNTVLSIMAGALFGLAWGSAAAIAGILLAAILQYILARQLLRPLINRFVEAKPSLVDIQKAVIHDELKLQALLRLTPFEPAIMSYMFGAMGVRFGGYVLACMCLIPGTLVSVYVGYAGSRRKQNQTRIGDF